MEVRFVECIVNVVLFELNSTKFKTKHYYFIELSKVLQVANLRFLANFIFLTLSGGFLTGEFHFLVVNFRFLTLYCRFKCEDNCL